MASTPRTRIRPPFGSTAAGLMAIGLLLTAPVWAAAVGPTDGWSGFMGRFHPVVLHLPIGIVCLAALLEVACCADRSKPPHGAGWLVLGAGAVSAMVAAVTGMLLLHGGGDYAPALVSRHMWGGIAFACGMIVVLLAKRWAEVLGRGGWLYRGLLFGNVALMAFASHDGGSLTHGPDFLTGAAPDGVRKLLKLPSKPVVASARPVEAGSVYAEIVAPILERRCNSCHNKAKAKGKLRTDTHAFLLKGGKEGPAVIAGKASESGLIVRAELPVDDEERMPPDGKPGFTEAELVVLKWWIDQGADPVKTAGEWNPPVEVKAALQEVARPQ